jgi:hypothetical protein
MIARARLRPLPSRFSPSQTATGLQRCGRVSRSASTTRDGVTESSLARAGRLLLGDSVRPTAARRAAGPASSGPGSSLSLSPQDESVVVLQFELAYRYLYRHPEARADSTKTARRPRISFASRPRHLFLLQLCCISNLTWQSSS